MSSTSSSYRHERQFSVVLALILAGVGFWPLIEARPPSWVWIGLACALLLLAWLAAGLLSPVVRVWMKVGHAVGVVNTGLLLAIVFFLFITPLALLFRLLRRDALALRLKRQHSYWLEQNRCWSPDSFKNQF